MSFFAFFVVFSKHFKIFVFEILLCWITLWSFNDGNVRFRFWLFNIWYIGLTGNSQHPKTVSKSQKILNYFKKLSTFSKKVSDWEFADAESYLLADILLTFIAKNLISSYYIVQF